MRSEMLGLIIALSLSLCGGLVRAAEPEVDTGIDLEALLPRLKPGEDAMVANRNVLLNKMAEQFDERVTVVKFDDDHETKCPRLTSLFSSTGHRLKWLTPDSSLDEENLFLRGRGPDGTSAVLVVKNAACRYIVTIRRFERESGEEKVVRVENIHTANERKVFTLRKAGKSWFSQQVLPFVDPSEPIDFTGIAFFAPTTLTIYLANAAKDLKISSESNFLKHTYTIEIKNPQAALRMSISKEVFSNGRWVNAYAR